MSTPLADRPLDPRRTFHLDTVVLVDSHGPAAAPSGRLPDSLPQQSATAPPAGTTSGDEVLTSLVAELGRTHFDRVSATITRRRSLTDSLQVALAAFWDTVVAHPDEHHAAHSLRARRGDNVADPRPGTATTFADASGISTWLQMIADVHHIRWELPLEQLALLLTATLDGLVLDFLATGDPEPARDVLRVLAYQIAQYGRRPAKNQQH